MDTRSILLLTRSEVRSVLSLAKRIDAVESAFRARGQSLPLRLLHAGRFNGEFHIKIGRLKAKKAYLGPKANGRFFANQERYGLPNIQGIILLFDGANGCLLSVVDSLEITLLRTGAATAIAAKRLARNDSRVVTICGFGHQREI